MKASVIIPAYNEEDEIIDCLESLGYQTYPNFEIIVVDDGSTDDTRREVENLHKVIPSIKLLKQNHKGPALARNLGASKATGKILVFLDADMTFEKDFLEKLLVPINNGDAKGSFSKEEYVSNWKNTWAQCWSINQNWPPDRRHPKNYPDHDRVFRAILKSEFDRVGGFDRGGYTDDHTLSSKLGYHAVAARGAKFYHKNPDNLKEIFLQAKWSAKREYKLGILGRLFSLARSFMPLSIFIGLYKAMKFREANFVWFKIVYDLGIYIGILEYMALGKETK